MKFVTDINFSTNILMKLIKREILIEKLKVQKFRISSILTISLDIQYELIILYYTR